MPRLSLPVLTDGLDPATMPRTRADCLPSGKNQQRPCGWLTCRANLLAEGSVTESCVLDLLDREAGALSLDAIDSLLGGVTRERIRQIEAKALRKLLRKPGRALDKLRAYGEPE